MAVVSSCREMYGSVLQRAQPLSLVILNKEYNETASVKLEEDEDEVKSACPLYSGRHTCYNGRDKEKLACKSWPISKTRSQFGLSAATRRHEAGIASNRWSAIQR